MNLPGWDGLSLEDRVATVKRAWAMPVRRLLIFDNLEDRELLAQWRPKTGGGQVLVTSRRGDWRATDGVTELPLRPLDRSASYQVLLGPRAYEQEAQIEAWLADAQQRAAADAICDELGDLPLALALAGACLAANPRLAPADYHQRLQELLQADPALTEAMAAVADLPTRYRRGVAATLALSYAQLTPEDDAAALTMFHRLAWLAALPVPEALLTALSDGQAPDPALRRLRAVGLIDRREVQLHRLVAAFGRERDPEPAATLSATVEAALAVMDNQDLNKMPLAGIPYRPHLEELCRHTDRLAGALAARLLTTTGRLLYAQGDYTVARRQFEQALTIHDRTLGPDHPDTATSLTDLALCLNAQGEYAVSRPLFERALAIRERALGPDHPDTAQSLNNLAVCLDAQGEYAAARPLLERALAIAKRTLGPDHPNTAISLNNLAVCLDAQGEYAAARPLFERALAICERSLGPDHPDTATSLNNLALCLDAQGGVRGGPPTLRTGAGDM
jgi:tetratricopeptide (TPR) repeat protein